MELLATKYQQGSSQHEHVLCSPRTPFQRCLLIISWFLVMNIANFWNWKCACERKVFNKCPLFTCMRAHECGVCVGSTRTSWSRPGAQRFEGWRSVWSKIRVRWVTVLTANAHEHLSFWRKDRRSLWRKNRGSQDALWNKTQCFCG